MRGAPLLRIERCGSSLIGVAAKALKHPHDPAQAPRSRAPAGVQGNARNLGQCLGMADAVVAEHAVAITAPPLG